MVLSVENIERTVRGLTNRLGGGRPTEVKGETPKDFNLPPLKGPFIVGADGNEVAKKTAEETPQTKVGDSTKTE